MNRRRTLSPTSDTSPISENLLGLLCVLALVAAYAVVLGLFRLLLAIGWYAA